MLFSLSPAGYPAMQMIMKLNLKLYMYSASLLSLSAQSAYKSGRDQGPGSGLHFKALLIANWVSRCEMGSANENLKCGKEVFSLFFCSALTLSLALSFSLSFSFLWEMSELFLVTCLWAGMTEWYKRREVSHFKMEAHPHIGIYVCCVEERNEIRFQRYLGRAKRGPVV